MFIKHIESRFLAMAKHSAFTLRSDMLKFDDWLSVMAFSWATLAEKRGGGRALSCSSSPGTVAAKAKAKVASDD
jgi:hypothetical protein